MLTKQLALLVGLLVTFSLVHESQSVITNLMSHKFRKSGKKTDGNAAKQKLPTAQDRLPAERPRWRKAGRVDRPFEIYQN